MAFRGNESPMDFEWQGYGPIDPNSPFHRVAMENAKKRTHTQFQSPQKSSFPTLREPNGKPFYFSNLPQPESSPYRAPSFTTPRKPFDIDFSSGPESSPADQADNEDTPDGKPLPALPVDFNGKPSEKRNSLFGMYGRFAPSSGRGEIKKPASDAMAKRIHKKRRQGQKFALSKQLAMARRDSEDSSEDDTVTSPHKQEQTQVHDVGYLTAFFTFIHSYPDAPTILAKYLCLMFNTVMICGFVYIIYSFCATIKADVDRASEEAVQEILSEMAACSKNYIENRCAADTRLPALEQVCANWELCMNRDPNAVRRGRLSAHTFAEIYTSFMEPISLKAFTFTVVFFVLGLLVNNGSYMWFRKTQEQHDGYRHPSNPYMPTPAHFPATPGHRYEQYQSIPWQTNDRGYQAQIEYQRSPTKENRARSRSPEKKKQHLYAA